MLNCEIDVFERALKRAKLQREVNDNLRKMVDHTKKQNEELRQMLLRERKEHQSKSAFKMGIL